MFCILFDYTLSSLEVFERQAEVLSLIAVAECFVGRLSCVEKYNEGIKGNDVGISNVF